MRQPHSQGRHVPDDAAWSAAAGLSKPEHDPAGRVPRGAERRASEPRPTESRAPESRTPEHWQDMVETLRRFELALGVSGIGVAVQDLDLFYRQAFNPASPIGPDPIGRSDESLYPAAVADHLTALKRSVLATGDVADTEIVLPGPSGRRWVRLHLAPEIAPDGAITGLISVGVDVTDEHRRTEEMATLTRLLLEANARIDVALRDSSISLFRQNTDLAYTWAYNPPVGLADQDLVGLTDADVLPEVAARLLTAAKQRVVETGRPEKLEVSLKAPETTLWFDVRVEPLVDEGGLVGVTTVMVDITHQKEIQQQLRMVMRELTHRSKNLLAVVQGIARQTAQTVDSLPAFIDRFGARLYAVGRAHDVLVDESWRGGSIQELVTSQLGHIVSTDSGERMTVSGPRAMLRPEAAQNVALALHELATNAAKYGALSNETGCVSVRWGVVDAESGPPLFEIVWEERGGPAVREPQRRGFGRLMIEKLVPRAIEGTSDLGFDPDGLTWVLRFPTTYLAEGWSG
jgi:two-component sensor histidine kinase